MFCSRRFAVEGEDGLAVPVLIIRLPYGSQLCARAMVPSAALSWRTEPSASVRKYCVAVALIWEMRPSPAGRAA